MYFAVPPSDTCSICKNYDQLIFRFGDGGVTVGYGLYIRYQELDLFLYADYNGGPDVKKYP